MPSIPPLLRVLPGIALADLASRRGVREQTLPFGEGRHQYALACFPDDDDRDRPWVFFLHGGGWQQGSPREYAFVGRYFAGRGFPTVLGGYRLAPRSRWPAQLEDARAGLEAALVAEPALRERPLVLAGFSAGGHLAAMLALGVGGDPPARLAGLLAVAAPLDLSVYPVSPLIEGLTGHGSPWPEADPLTHLVSPPPQTLLPHGRRDRTVPTASSRRFAAAAERIAPGRVEVLEVPWAQHADVLRLFLEDLPESRVVLEWLAARG